MIYSVLTAIAAFLLSGNVWAGIFGLAVGAVATRLLRDRAEEEIEKRGGVEDARVLKQVCYSDGGRRPRAEDREYTVLVRYRNGERYRYTLRGNTALFSKLRPYLGN